MSEKVCMCVCHTLSLTLIQIAQTIITATLVDNERYNITFLIY